MYTINLYVYNKAEFGKEVIALYRLVTKQEILKSY